MSFIIAPLVDRVPLRRFPRRKRVVPGIASTMGTLALVLGGSLLGGTLSGCGILTENIEYGDAPTVATVVFDPTAGKVPYPHDALYANALFCPATGGAAPLPLVDPLSGAQNCDPQALYESNPDAVTLALNPDRRVALLDRGHVNLPNRDKNGKPVNCAAPDLATTNPTRAIICQLNEWRGFSTIMPPYAWTRGGTLVDAQGNNPTFKAENALIFGFHRDAFATVLALVTAGVPVASLADTAEKLQKFGAFMGVAGPAGHPVKVSYNTAINRLEVHPLRPLPEDSQFVTLLLSGRDAQGQPMGLADIQGRPLERSLIADLLMSNEPLCLAPKGPDGKPIGPPEPVIGLLRSSPPDENGNWPSCALDTLRSAFAGVVPTLSNVSKTTDPLVKSLLGPMPVFESHQVVGVWPFKTRPVTHELFALRCALTGCGPGAPAAIGNAIVPTLTGQPALVAASDTSVLNRELVSQAFVFKGTLLSADFLQNEVAAPSATSDWQRTFHLKPDGSPDVKPAPLEFLLTVPTFGASSPEAAAAACAADETKCIKGVVLAQHGYTGEKANMLTLADDLAAHGLAMVAIDLVLHGSRKQAKDGAKSGDGFVTANLFAMRDHFRQSVIDQVQAIRSIRFDKPAGQDTIPGGIGVLLKGMVKGGNLRTLKVAFLGQSMGAIVGGVLAGVEDTVSTYVLNVGGARLPYVFTESADPTISGTVISSLAGIGIQPNTPEYFQFIDIAGWVLEQGDPFAYIHAAAWDSNLLKLPNFSEDGMELRPRHVLLQVMDDDRTVPNSSSEYLASSACNGLTWDHWAAAPADAPATIIKDQRRCEKGPDGTTSPKGKVALALYANAIDEADRTLGHGFLTSTRDGGKFSAQRTAARHQAARFILSDGADLATIAPSR